MTDYPLDDFITDLSFILTAVEEEAEVLAAAQPLVARFAATAPDWLAPEHYACDESLGWGEVLLHKAPEGGLNLWTAAWLPGRGVPPHDHGTWAVIAGLVGSERNTFWQSPGGGAMQEAEVRTLAPGDVLQMPQAAIHSVVNPGEEVSVSLHVYGRDLAYTGRRQYDPESGAAKPIGKDLE